MTIINPRCMQWKPPADFYRNRSEEDGLTVYCRPCWAARRTDRDRDLIRVTDEATRRLRERHLGEYERLRQEVKREWGLLDRMAAS